MVEEQVEKPKQIPAPVIISYHPFFLTKLAQAAIAMAGAGVSIAFGFKKEWVLTAATIAVALAFAGASAILRFYRKQLVQREESHRNACEAAIEARGYLVDARQEKIKELEAIMADTETRHNLALWALRDFIHCCTESSGKLHDGLSELSAGLENDGSSAKATLQLGKSFISDVLYRMIRVFDPLVVPPVGRSANLWASFRILQPHEEGGVCFVILDRAGGFHPDRRVTSEAVAADHPLMKRLFDADGENAGITIASPDDPDFFFSKNYATYKDSTSLLLGALIFAKNGHRCMPMFASVNSALPGLFTDDCKPYMKCCMATFCMALRPLLDLLFTEKLDGQPQ